jgi:hypothetical protein
LQLLIDRFISPSLPCRLLTDYAQGALKVLRSSRSKGHPLCATSGRSSNANWGQIQREGSADHHRVCGFQAPKRGPNLDAGRGCLLSDAAASLKISVSDSVENQTEIPFVVL